MMKQLDNQNYDSIGKRIFKLRTERGWKPAQLAEKINVTDKAIWKWENDRGEPSLDCLILLAKVFGVSLDYLIVGYDEMESEATNQNNSDDMQYVISGKTLYCRQRIRARTHADLLNKLLDKSMKAYYRCLYRLEDNCCIWMINLSQVPSRFGWVNIQDGDNIVERYVGSLEDKLAAHNEYVGEQKRFIFDVKTDAIGRYYEFKGLYRCNEHYTADLRIWELEK